MENNRPHVLLVDPSPDRCRMFERAFGKRGVPVLSAHTGREATQLAMAWEVAVAVVDLNLPDQTGLSVIERLREIDPTIECVALTENPGEAEAALLAGATETIDKPLSDSPRLLRLVRRATEVKDLRRTLEKLEPRVSVDEVRAPRLLGHTPAIERVRGLVDRMAGAVAPVLLTGESGVGKEVVAEMLHEQGRRRGEFVRINCAALPESLIEAELFGAEEGTFTGQKGRREGLFAMAEHGTLFLDEIGEMPVGLQPKLLRVLQGRRYRPLGARTERELTARVIAATNVDLRRAIGRGGFREDLFFRLNVLTIHMPPLRERMADLPLLATHFARTYGASEGRASLTLSSGAMAALSAHDWTGNVRELANTVMRGVVLAMGPQIEAIDLGLAPQLPQADVGPLQTSPDWEQWMQLPLAEAKAEANAAFVSAYLARKLAQCNGNVTRAAAMSGLHRPNFKREMRRYSVGVDEGDAPRSAGGSSNAPAERESDPTLPLR